MNELGWNPLAQVADASVRAVVLAGAAALLMLLPYARRAAVQHALWTTVIAGMLLLPFTPPLPKSAAAQVVLPHVTWPAVPATAAVRAAPAQPLPAQGGALPFRTLTAAGYLAVALFFAVRLLLAHRAAQQIRGRSREIDDLRARAANEEVCARYGISWPLPGIRESDEVRVPLTAGGREVILPAGWRAWDEWTLAAVLAHEFAHIVRRDRSIVLLAAVNKCIFWFHPLAWWLERRVATLAEHAADDCSLRTAGDRPRYAELLLGFAEAARGGRVAACGSAMARPGIRGRVGRVLAAGHGSSGFARRAVWVAMAACLGPVFYAVSPSRAQNVATMEPPAGLEAMTAAGGMTAAEAQKLEEHLRSNPEDVETRSKLIAYYFLNAVRQPRLDHIFWLIENHPDSRVHGLYHMRFPNADSPLNSRADYERACELWLSQARKHAGNPDVLANAAENVMQRDLGTAEDLLQQARALDPKNPARTSQLAVLYVRALAALRMAGISPAIGAVPPAIVNRWATSQVNAAFAAGVRSRLESSQDAALVGEVGAHMARLGRESFVSSDPGLTERFEEAARLNREDGRRFLERAAQLEPANPRWRAFLREGEQPVPTPPRQQPGKPDAPARIRVGANVQAAMLIEGPPAVYPEMARRARIQGVVRIELTVGKEGGISNMRVMSGHPLLIPAAMEAVKQYRYRPTLLNGAPVEVISTVDVPFTLNRQ